MIAIARWRVYTYSTVHTCIYDIVVHIAWRKDGSRDGEVREANVQSYQEKGKKGKRGGERGGAGAGRAWRVCRLFSDH